MKQRPKRKPSQFGIFAKAQREVASEILSVYGGKGGKLPRITIPTLRGVYLRDNGQCRICGVPLLLIYERYERPHFKFFRSLKNGGKVSGENLLTVCATCIKGYRIKHRNLQKPPSGSLISDQIESLAKITQSLQNNIMQRSKLHAEKEPDLERIAELDKEYIKNLELKEFIKRELDDSLAEMVDLMCYRPVRDAHEPTKFLYGTNTIANTIEEVITSSGEKAEEKKKKLGEELEEIVTTKQYIILRPGEDDEDSRR